MDRELLESILYELRLVNWQLSGRKGSAPLRPGQVDEGTTTRSFSGKVVHVRGVNEAISRSIRSAQDDLDGQESA